MARKCKTALVDPPKATTVVTAFSIEFLVTMSKGFISISIRLFIAFPVSCETLFLELLFAGIDEENGKDIPRASIAEAIVFAVYIPPQAPEPGHDFLIISLYSLSSITPATFSPQASNDETISNFLFL